MIYLLHIESSSTLCSVALSRNDRLLALKELDEGYTHAENLHVFIRQLLSEQGLQPSQLSAISVSSGPGSYTGLRIGFSSAKGLAYALQIPLIVVDTLKLMASQAQQHVPEAEYYCPMIDARRMEVYTAVFDASLAVTRQAEALVLNSDTVQVYRQFAKRICFFGDGMPKARTLLESFPEVTFLEGIRPGSEAMIALAWQQYQQGQVADTAYATPFYLKDFYFTTSKN